MNAGAVPFAAGPQNPRWKGGKTRNQDGYVRVTAGKHRHKYEHRVAMEECINQGISFPPGFSKGGGIPAGYEVHHFDTVRSHNCIENLMLLSEPIHHAVEASKRSYFRKRKKEKQ